MKPKHKLFSYREGFKQTHSYLQVDSISSELRNKLWNFFKVICWDRGASQYGQQDLEALCLSIWHHYFELTLDEMPGFQDERYSFIRRHFFGCEWAEVYDFIEFVATVYENKQDRETFRESCNFALEDELSAYRLVDGKIIRLTSEHEISEVERALDVPIGSVRGHLKRSIELLSPIKGKKPDYRNAIKEAISAVEALCRIITKDKSATLAQALKTIDAQIEIHGALKEGLNRIYGYTSDENGIRHSLMNESTLGFEDANFMLVVCSAFVNYLVEKANKAGIKLKEP